MCMVHSCSNFVTGFYGNFVDNHEPSIYVCTYVCSNLIFLYGKEEILLSYLSLNVSFYSFSTSMLVCMYTYMYVHIYVCPYVYVY